MSLCANGCSYIGLEDGQTQKETQFLGRISNEIATRSSFCRCFAMLNLR